MQKLLAGVAFVCATSLVAACGDAVPVPFSVSVSPSSPSISPGQTVTLTATVRDEDNNIIPSSGVAWSSATTSVATVNSSGVLTGVAPGTSIITAQAGLSASGTATVTVLAGVAQVLVSPSSASLNVGQTVQLSASPRDADGDPISSPVSWSTNNSAAATVSSTGLVTAQGVGGATITAESEGVTGTASISVSQLMIRVDVENQLAAAVSIRANATTLGQVAAGTVQQFTMARPDTLRLFWDLVRPTTGGGTPVGDQISASFAAVTVGSDSTFPYPIDNVIGNDTIFAPLITNNAGEGLLMGVNMGLPEENRCNCVVPDGGSLVLLGYYQWRPTSSVRGYHDGTNYTGGFVFWDRPGMDAVLQPLDGTVNLVANGPPPAPPAAQRGDTQPPAAERRARVPAPATAPPERLHRPSSH